MKLKIKSKNGGIKFLIDVTECKTISSKTRGLMFRKKENAKALLFDFKKSKKMAIHSLFVFFPFVAFWLDKKNKIQEITFVRPFKFHIKPKKNYFKLLEIPINKRYQEKIQNLVGERKV
jgi:uncharacterized membrane protein (UPF0127 family)